jgi:signal transduction histidine kinase
MRLPPARREGQAARPRFGGTGPVARVLLLACIAVLPLFVGYELLERTWLSGTDGELLHVLHRVRGAAAALIAAGVASWLFLRGAPPLLPDASPSNERPSEGRVDAAQKRLHYARWFIVMRWIAVVIASVVVLTSVEIFGFLPREVGPRLGAVVVALALLNLGYSLHLRRGGASTRFLALQTYADVVALVVLLHFSGGVENPLTPLLLLHVIIAGIVLGRAHAYAVAGVASLLFAGVAWGEWSGALAHYTLTVFPHVHVDGRMMHAAHDPLYAGSRVGLQAAILLLVAYFTTSLVERMRQDEQRFEALADRALGQTQLLEAALDTTGTALCVCDRERRGQWSNRRWEEWTRHSPGVRCSAHGGSASPSAMTLEDGRVRLDEVRLEAVAGGSPGGIRPPARILQLTTAPLRDRDGRISHVATLARDVTAEREAHLRMVRTERLAAVGELAGQVAHEVNNPIAIISTKARLLLRAGGGDLPPKAVAELGKIVDLSDRVARIAQGLLSYCRPAPGVRQPLDLREPIRRALAYVELQAAEAGVRVEDDLPAGLPPVQGNAGELEQVFLNLFINALDAMPRGGRLRVAARAVPPATPGEPDRVEAVVEDTGCGIPAAIRERIFDPFLTTKVEGKGSGLGLSICLGLVRSHGGRIAVESEPGEPTRVRIRIPAAPAPRGGHTPGALSPPGEATAHV